MAIKDRIRAEARRTIDGIQNYYNKYGADVEDAEEKEHRIARIEAAMEGCNGLSQEDKVQKTAENLFELTCAQERAFDAMRKEIKILRDENNKEFDILRVEMREGMRDIIDKIQDSGFTANTASTQLTQSTQSNQSSQPSEPQSLHTHFISKLISEHPVVALNAFVFMLILVFISGHFDDILKVFGGQQ